MLYNQLHRSNRQENMGRLNKQKKNSESDRPHSENICYNVKNHLKVVDCFVELSHISRTKKKL